MVAEQKEWVILPTQKSKTEVMASQLIEVNAHIAALEELKKAQKLLAIQANLGRENTTESELEKQVPEQEPVVPDTVLEEARREEPVADMAPEKEKQWEKEIANMTNEIVAQVATQIN